MSESARLVHGDVLGFGSMVRTRHSCGCATQKPAARSSFGTRTTPATSDVKAMLPAHGSSSSSVKTRASASISAIITLLASLRKPTLSRRSRTASMADSRCTSESSSIAVPLLFAARPSRRRIRSRIDASARASAPP